MIRYLFFITVFGLIQISCKQQQKETVVTRQPGTITKALYSESVADSFYVFVSLPDSYSAASKQQYPVVYLLDANLYFDIIATTLRKYSEVGLAPEVILVGIGYKDFQLMDSLRNRDYTYPLAIPEYEMSVSGGADKFLAFISSKLIPFVDQAYHSDSTNRVLMGHSLGGYFTMYALLQHLSGKNNSFTSYIAASPSFHYNNYYLLNQFANLLPPKPTHSKIHSYISFGGLEESAANDPGTIRQSDLIRQLSDKLSAEQVNFKADIYSNLDHMDTQLPTFIKGLQLVSKN